MAGLDPNTVSQIIRGLELKKFILRKSSSDGSAKNPILTKKGFDLLKKAMPAVEVKDDVFFQDLTEKELEYMIGVFQKLLKTG